MSLPEPRHLERLPPARLPWVYLAAAHLALIWALGATLVHPTLLTDYFYQPRTIALVHAVTLGWVTCTILGALYIVGPVALRTSVPARRSDAIACAAVLIGGIGMISHFWIDAYSGMVWSAGTLLLGVTLVAARTVPAVLRAPVPIAVRFAVAMAFFNLLTAGLLGGLLGLEKIVVITVPGAVLPGVWAHAHLAGLGWATMMVMGIGYRLLPMFLPAAMPRGPLPLTSVVLVQLGVIGLGVGLVVAPAWAAPFAGLIVTGVGLFVFVMATRLREPRPSPRGLSRPDPTLGHNAMALLSLVLAMALGGLLLVLEPGPLEIRVAAAYGVLGLIGFLAQLIVGVGGRLLPMNAWMQSHVRSGFVEPDFTQYDLGSRRLQYAAVAGWAIAAPLLTLGVFLSSTIAVRVAASLLLGAVLLETRQRRIWWLAGRRRFTSPAAPSTAPESPPDS